MKLRDLAERLQCRLEGDGTLEVTRVAGIEDTGPGDLTFYANPRYAQKLHTTRATAVIAAEGVETPCATLRSPHPYLTFAQALELLHPQAQDVPGVHESAVVADTARLGPDVFVGPFVVIERGVVIGARSIVHAFVYVGEGAVVGEGCVIHSHVTIRERVTLGHRVVVQDGAVVGGDGFGFAQRPDGSHHKIPQIGTVIIGDDVEIGALAAIDRPSVGTTVVGRGTKIDNLVQVAHGAKIGEHVLLAAQVGVAGSTVIEDRVTLAGQVGVAGHLTVGRGTVATAQTGIPNSVEPGSFISGYPAIDNREWLKASAIFRRLPELKKRLSTLEERVGELEQKRRRTRTSNHEGHEG
ncbi:MAG: UDP-3-O-(3-hydroxymyristoyl)glucosamine N-acyltransferase [Luteitalea sp.]|nr:UDP-3-O-(3-hydroxymyristoyl)glucosamine N-acyltransferase [Luteitalea sp.]